MSKLTLVKTPNVEWCDENESQPSIINTTTIREFINMWSSPIVDTRQSQILTQDALRVSQLDQAVEMNKQHPLHWIDAAKWKNDITSQSNGLTTISATSPCLQNASMWVNSTTGDVSVYTTETISATSATTTVPYVTVSSLDNYIDDNTLTVNMFVKPLKTIENINIKFSVDKETVNVAADEKSKGSKVTELPKLVSNKLHDVGNFSDESVIKSAVKKTMEGTYGLYYAPYIPLILTNSTDAQEFINGTFESK